MLTQYEDFLGRQSFIEDVPLGILTSERQISFSKDSLMSYFFTYEPNKSHKKVFWDISLKKPLEADNTSLLSQ